MKRVSILTILAIAMLSSFCRGETASGEKETIEARIAGLQRHDGFIPYYWDEKKGDILFELSPDRLSREFLYFNGLGSGVGSTEIMADRSSFADAALCRFRRVGMRVLV